LSTDGKGQTSDQFDYRIENIWGIKKSTTGGLISGFIFKHTRGITPKKYQTFGLELVNVKHPQEVRYTSFTGNSYIFGKANYLYSIRLQYGRDFVLFKKASQQGVQINGIIAAGPTIGLVTPYYIELANGQRVPYDVNNPFHEQNNIVGTGALLQGLGESQVKIGINLKAALSFEFGTFKNSISGFEAGFMLEGFTDEIILVPAARNRAVFPSAFITLIYGSRK
jgi:hypothetical protein